MCPAACPVLPGKKQTKRIEMEPGKWDLAWAARDLRGTLAKGCLPLQISLQEGSLSSAAPAHICPGSGVRGDWHTWALGHTSLD